MPRARTDPAGTARHNAVRIVQAWLKSGEFPDRLMDAVPANRAAVMEMVYGSIRWYRTLDWIRAQFAPRRPRAELDAFLLVGLYELLFMTDSEEYAAVNETVEAAKSALGRKAANLVNAILRRAQAGKGGVFQTLEKQPVGIRLSHPDILVERWTQQFGANGAARLCEWNNRRAEVVIRVNTARTGRDAFLHDLREAGVEALPHGFDPGRFLTLPRGVAVAELPGYAEGWFSVQDPATAVAPDLLAVKPGERVLDACAAPGGKTAMLADSMQGRGVLVAMDASAERVARLRENLARLAPPAVRVMTGDASRPEEVRRACARHGWPEAFHAILLDVPCTNTGVLRRRPDARWRFSPQRLRRAGEKQKGILDGAAALLEAGGRIVYSTCSLEPEENEERVNAWLAAHAEFGPADSKKLFPPDTQTDGAYVSLLVKR